MREVLFRGKRIDNGEWVYGSYICRKNAENAEIYWESEPDYGGRYADGIYQVIPETVGQYTGLTVDGNKIFENDIIEYDETKNTYYQIVWINSGWGHKELDTGICELFSFNYGHNPTYFNNVKIAGNIYDNPELLDVE